MCVKTSIEFITVFSELIKKCKSRIMTCVHIICGNLSMLSRVQQLLLGQILHKICTTNSIYKSATGEYILCLQYNQTGEMLLRLDHLITLHCQK